MAMVSCPGCRAVANAEACVCPECGLKLRSCSSKVARTASAMMLGLALGCDGGPQPEPAYGIPFVDDDGDGYESDVDCDDTDANIYPEADETPGDGVDSNCDGEDDT
ncbi:MAG: putative metal-binding motif-containing protein [Alphaproteobacteria bacterium]|nr:putative metal-binding motif-containing protein [Alphaproteobacteria bacterium]